MKSKVILHVLLILMALFHIGCGKENSFQVSNEIKELQSVRTEVNQAMTEEELVAELKRDILPDQEADESIENENSLQETLDQIEYNIRVESQLLNIVTAQNQFIYPQISSYGSYNDANGVMRRLSGHSTYRLRQVGIDIGSKGKYRHTIFLSDQNSIKKILTCPPGMTRHIFRFPSSNITICLARISGTLTFAGQKAEIKISGRSWLSDYKLLNVYASASFIGTQRESNTNSNSTSSQVNSGCFTRGGDYFYTNGIARCEISSGYYSFSCPKKTRVSSSQFYSLANHGTCRPVPRPQPGCFQSFSLPGKYYTNGSAYCKLKPGTTCSTRILSSLQVKRLTNHGECR